MSRDDQYQGTNETSYCFNFTADELKINTAVTITLHTLAVIACTLVVIVILISRLHRIFINRLVLYLMIVAALWSLTIILETMPVYHNNNIPRVSVRPGWKGMCAAIGFITQIIESAKILVVCWIVLYLTLLVVFKYNASRRTHEAFGLIIVVVLPLLLDWLPFEWNMYGLSGLWCWIMLTDDVCNDRQSLGLGLMFGVEYGPVLLASILTLISFIIIIIALCRRAYRTEIKWKWASVYQKGLNEAMSLLAYPLIYAVIFIFRVIHRTYYAIQITNTQPPYYTLWLAQTAALGIGALLIPLAFLLHPNNLKKVSCCKKYFMRRSDSTGAVVYRTNSLISTDYLSEAEPFTSSDNYNLESSLVYKSILSSH